MRNYSLSWDALVRLAIGYLELREGTDKFTVFRARKLNGVSTDSELVKLFPGSDITQERLNIDVVSAERELRELGLLDDRGKVDRDLLPFLEALLEPRYILKTRSWSVLEPKVTSQVELDILLSESLYGASLAEELGELTRYTLTFYEKLYLCDENLNGNWIEVSLDELIALLFCSIVGTRIGDFKFSELEFEQVFNRLMDELRYLKLDIEGRYTPHRVKAGLDKLCDRGLMLKTEGGYYEPRGEAEVFTSILNWGWYSRLQLELFELKQIMERIAVINSGIFETGSGNLEDFKPIYRCYVFTGPAGIVAMRWGCETGGELLIASWLRILTANS